MNVKVLRSDDPRFFQVISDFYQKVTHEKIKEEDITDVILINLRYLAKKLYNRYPLRIGYKAIINRILIIPNNN